jgi:hypothetical protein
VIEADHRAQNPAPDRQSRSCFTGFISGEIRPPVLVIVQPRIPFADAARIVGQSIWPIAAVGPPGPDRPPLLLLFFHQKTAAGRRNPSPFDYQGSEEQREFPLFFAVNRPMAANQATNLEASSHRQQIIIKLGRNCKAWYLLT